MAQCLQASAHEITDASGTTTYTYDSMDRLITKATPEGTLNYTFDAAGHVASIASSNANGASVSYTYDDLNRLSTVVDNRLSGNNTTTYTYDPASNVATVTYPNGVQSTFTYDTLNRVTGLSSATASYTYQRGPDGSLTSVSESSGRGVTWNYDGIDRLTQETIAGAPSGKNGALTYNLDPVGNRLSDTSSLSGISAASATYNPDDEASSETYDQNGNVTSTGGKAFAYDAENHLVSMNGGAVTLVYDAFGNRVAKTVNGVTTKYLVEDDVNPTGYPQVMEEIVNGVVQREYTYGLQRISENQPISGTWTPSFYGYDGGGSVRLLTNAAGAVTDTYEYDAFGNSFTVSGSTPNDYLYRGEQFDSDLELYYLRARYYNAATGRFMSRDPKNGYPQLPMTLHKYLYVRGNPVNRIDPQGLEDLVETPTLTERSIRAAVPFANAIACGIGVGITLGEGDLVKDFNEDPPKALAGLGFTAYGCVTVTWAPAGPLAWVNSGINVGACAFGLYQAVESEDVYLKDPTESNGNRFKIDLTGGLIGCAVSLVGEAIGD